MRRWSFRHYALSSCVTAALLAGCGGSQLPANAPGVTPQTSEIASRSAAHRLSASYQQLYLFRPPTDGTHPAAGLLDVNGTLYGTTSAGGLRHRGAVYRISTSGEQKVLYRFRSYPDGSDPRSGLLNVNGTLYGTTYSGGGSGCSYNLGCGTVYSVSTSGREKVLYAFQGGSDGAYPQAGLIDVNGTLYGTTSQGGSGCESTSTSGCGTVFSVTMSGQETVLHRFAAGSDGAHPNHGGLIEIKGVLYGATFFGGSSYVGTVFSITPAGVEKVLYAFQGGSDGINPESGLIDVNGMLYGTTTAGGGAGSGTVYRISTAGAEKVVYSFAGTPDGANPGADLIEVDGMLYGTTTFGGYGDFQDSCILNVGCGTVFGVTTGGMETVLYRFAGASDGFFPEAPLTNVNGTLYGTTFNGGDHDVCCHVYGYGTVFAVTP